MCNVLTEYPNSNHYFGSNASGCNSKAEVEIACAPLPTIYIYNDDANIAIYPNPTSDLLKITTEKDTSYSIFNVNGRVKAAR